MQQHIAVVVYDKLLYASNTCTSKQKWIVEMKTENKTNAIECVRANMQERACHSMCMCMCMCVCVYICA